MSTSCRKVVHTSVGPTKNCARWTLDDITQQPARRGPSWFKNNPGTHQVILTDPDAPPPDTASFQPDAQLSEGAVACTIVGGKTSGRRGRATRQNYPNPDLTSPGVQALMYSPYDDDRRGFLVAHQSSDPSELLQFAPWSLEGERLDWCVRQAPAAALEYAALHLTPDHLVYCVRKVTTPEKGAFRLAGFRSRAIQAVVADEAFSVFKARPYMVSISPQTYLKERETLHHQVSSLSRYKEVHSLRGKAVFVDAGKPNLVLDVTWEMEKEGEMYRGVVQAFWEQVLAQGTISFSFKGRTVKDVDSFVSSRAGSGKYG